MDKSLRICAIFVMYITLQVHCTTTKDVIFVIDRSGSIGNSDLQIGLEFIYNVTSWLTIGTGAIDVAVVSFSDTSRTDINLGKYTTQATLLQAINGLTLVSGGGTDTGSALSDVRTSVIPSGRSNVDKAVVVLTDGLSNSKSSTITEATSLKAISGVSLFSVGIGSALLTNNDEIRQMASDPETYYVHFVYSFVYICNLVPSIVPKLDPNSAVLSVAGCPSIPPNLQSGWFPWETETTTVTESEFDNRMGEFVSGVLVGCVSLFLVTYLLYILWSRIITFPSTLPLVTKAEPSTKRSPQQKTRGDKKEDKTHDKKEDEKRDKKEDNKRDKKEDNKCDKKEDNKRDKKEDNKRDKKEDNKRDKKEDNSYLFATGNVLTNYAPFSTSFSRSAR